MENNFTSNYVRKRDELVTKQQRKEQLLQDLQQQQQQRQQQQHLNSVKRNRPNQPK